MDGDTFDPFLWGVWLFILIGAAASAGSLYWLSRRLALFLAGARAQGTIVGIHSTSSTDSKGRSTRSHHPIAEFQDAEGRTHRVTGSTGHQGRGDRVGTKVTVCYARGNPQRAMILTFWQAWAGPLFTAIFGAGFLGLGLLALTAMTMEDAPDEQARAQTERMRARFEAMQEEVDDEEEAMEETKSGAQVPTDLFAKPKR